MKFQAPTSGNVRFSLFVTYYLTWQTTLNFNTSYRLNDIVTLAWLAFSVFLITILMTYIVERFLKRPLFGSHEAIRFSFWKALLISAITIALLAGFFLLTAPRIFNAQQIVTYAIGYVLGTGMLTYFFTDKEQ